MTDQPPYNPRDHGIQPARDLAAHLTASRKQGLRFAIGLCVLTVVYLLAIWQTGGQAGVMISGGIILIAAVLFAYRLRRVAERETDRLIDGMNAKRTEDQ